MAGPERIAELESALEEARQKLERAKEEASRKLAQQRDELEKAKENESELSRRLKVVETELDHSRLHAEVERLRAVARAREEENNRSQKWVED